MNKIYLTDYGVMVYDESKKVFRSTMDEYVIPEKLIKFPILMQTQQTESEYRFYNDLNDDTINQIVNQIKLYLTCGKTKVNISLYD